MYRVGVQQSACVRTVYGSTTVQADLFEWHVNLFLVDDDAPCHLRLRFPENYPSAPPKIDVFTPFPHAAITRTGTGFSLCLDLLEIPPASAKKAKP